MHVIATDWIVVPIHRGVVQTMVNNVTTNCISVLQQIVHALNQKKFCMCRLGVHESAWRNISVINKQCSFFLRRTKAAQHRK